MSQIVVDDEEAALIKKAATTVQVVDKEGKLVGFVTRATTDEELERWRQRLPIEEPTYTTEEVFQHLRSLEER